MFGKLLKWDIKSQKKIVYYYLLMMVVGGLARLAMVLQEHMGKNPVMDIVVLLSRFLVGGAAFAACIISSIMIILHFRNNLFKDEGYLMHTLPVTAGQLIFSKILSAFLLFLASIAAIYLEISISLGDFIGPWKWIYESFSQEFPDHQGVWILLGFAALALVQTLSGITLLYVSISSGYRFSSNRDAWSAVLYILIYSCYEIILVIWMVIGYTVIYKDFNLLLQDSVRMGLSVMKYILVMGGAASVISAIVSIGVSIRNIKKYLNLE